MSENKHTTLDQMKDFAQRQDARDDVQEERLAQHEEALGGVVKYTEQALTDEQKAQARENIGAGTSNVKTWGDLDDKPFFAVQMADGVKVSGNTITWDGNTTGLEKGGIYSNGVALLENLYLVSDDPEWLYNAANNAKAISALNNDLSTPASIAFFQVAEDIYITSGEDPDETYTDAYDSAFSVVFEDNARYTITDTIEFVYPKKGVYFNKHSDTSYIKTLTFADYDVESTVSKRINEAVLPSSVESVIIRSSTKGSTKKFELTVDDSGTISATEVTE